MHHPHHRIFTLDLGPEFLGWSGTIEGKIVCVVPPGLFEQDVIQRTVRALARRQGAQVPECPCLYAPAGKADAAA